MTRMENYLDRCESLEVEVKEREFYVLVPDEQNVDIRHIALHARGDRHQRLFHTFSQQGRSELWVVRNEHEGMLVTHEQKSQELCQAIEHTGEKQEMLVARQWNFKYSLKKK